MTEFSGRAARALLMLAFAALPAWFLWDSGWSPAAALGIEAAVPAEYVSLEDAVHSRMPYAQELTQLGLDLRLLGGQREQNGIFISEAGLMRNIDPPLEASVAGNADALLAFAEQYSAASNGKKNTYLAILPTAAGVLQQNLPRYAHANMVDQQRLIEEMYNGVSEQVRTIDVFSVLQNRRDQYIYYRTDSGLTALGGFHAYTAIARRLEISNRSLGLFDIEYIDHNFYGDLYQTPEGGRQRWGHSTAPYRRVMPDTLSLYRYSGNREYIVSQRGMEGSRMYHTLYPMERMELGPKLDVYLGGTAAVTEIRSSARSGNRLLVFGDGTAASYLPFLANHYRQVTLANLYYMTQGDFEALQPERYDQVLFAYGIETYIHTRNPALVRHVVWQEKTD